MPLPTQGDQHVDALLTDVSVAYMQADTKFVAGQVFPRVSVQKQSGRIATYSKADLLRDEMEVRGPGSVSAGGGYRVSTTTYVADVYAFHQDVDDQAVANADTPFSPVRDATQFVTSKSLIKQEVDWASSFFTTGLWTGSSTSTDLIAGTDFTAWDDVAGSPINDISDQAAEIESKTGYLPNTLVINRRAWNAIKNHPDVIDRIKHTSAQSITTDVFARLCDLDRVLVGAAVKNSAQEGLASSVGYIFGNHALLVYAAPSPSLMVPSGGYTFVWSGLTGAAEGRRIKRFRMEDRASDRIEIEAAWDAKVVAADVGAFFSAVAS